VESNKKQLKEEAFKQDAIDQRPSGQPPPYPHIFSDKHDFPQDQGIEEGKAVHLVVNAVLSKKKALIKGEQSKDDPQIQGHQHKPLPFLENALPNRYRSALDRRVARLPSPNLPSLTFPRTLENAFLLAAESLRVDILALAKLMTK
jgi:hypothetical protein